MADLPGSRNSTSLSSDDPLGYHAHMYFNELVAAYDKQRRERNVYHDLMRFRVREVLLVGSLYDSFVVESDGVLTEQIYGEYFNFTSTRQIFSVTSSTSEKVTSTHPFERSKHLKFSNVK